MTLYLTLTPQAANAKSVVRVGTDPSRMTAVSGQPVSYIEPYTHHHVTLRNLTHSTRYFYQVSPSSTHGPIPSSSHNPHRYGVRETPV